MSHPVVDAGTKICVVTTQDGVKIYGNRAALLTLSRWMAWIANSDPGEHYECHLLWHLASETSEASGKSSDVWALFDTRTYPAFQHPSPGSGGFEVTFMVVEESDLAKLAEFRQAGLLPVNWGREEENPGTSE